MTVSVKIRGNLTSKSYKGFNIYIIPAFILALLNIIFLRNSTVSYFIVILEIVFLLMLLFKMNIEKYLCWLMIFLASSIEFQVFTSNIESDLIFGFKHFRVFGINLSLIFVLLACFMVLLTKLKAGPLEFKFRNTNLFLILVMLLALMADGIIMGALNLIMNNNGIRGIPNYLYAFMGEIYLGAWPIILFFLIYYALMQSKCKGEEFEKALIAMMTANCIAPIITASMGFMGSYGDLDYMLVSSSAILIPYLVLFPAYEKYKNKFCLFYSLFFLGTIVPMVFFSYVSGKHILILYFIPIIYILIKIQKDIKLLWRGLLFSLVFGLIIYLAFNFALESSGTLFESKFKEATSVLGIWTPDWVGSMEPSSRFRISEGINVWLEYSRVPIQLFFGKGYMGSVTDHIAGFGWDPSGSFPIEQFNNGTFYQLHEITGYLLKYGVLGLSVWLFVFKLTLKNISNNPWIVIGCFWFLLFFGYSQTISIVGMMSLAYGIYLIDNSKFHHSARFSVGIS